MKARNCTTNLHAEKVFLPVEVSNKTKYLLPRQNRRNQGIHMRRSRYQKTTRCFWHLQVYDKAVLFFVPQPFCSLFSEPALSI